MPEPDLSAIKLSSVVHVPAEALLDLAYTREPTAEQRAEAERQRIKQAARLAAFRQQLADVTDPLARKILDLHHRDDRGQCVGCDPGSYAEDCADWPCSTIEAIAEHYEIELP